MGHHAKVLLWLSFFALPNSVLGKDTIKVSQSGDIVGAIDRVPSVHIDLGTTRAGAILDAEMKLTNRTSETLRFDSVAPSCNCTKVTPTNGAVAPGESLVFRLAVNMNARPNSTKSGDMVHFNNSKSTEFELHFQYGFETHAGFAGPLVVTEWISGEEEVDVRVPVVVGELVSEEDLDLELSSEECDLSWKLSKDKKELLIRMNFDDSNARDFTGDLTLVNLASGTQSGCQLLVRTRKPIRVYPRVIRMVADKQGDYTGYLFSEMDSLDYSRPVGVKLRLSALGSEHDCDTKSVGKVNKHRVFIRNDSLNEESAGTGKSRFEASLTFDVTYQDDGGRPSQPEKSIKTEKYVLEVPVLLTGDRK